MNPVEKATIKDVPQMHQLINYFADKGDMLARSLSEIYENIRDYLVVRQGERVIACVALHVCWSDLAEIKSVAVVEDSQEQGIGTQLVEACLKEARELGIPTVFCFTYQPAFFKRQRFVDIDKMELPRKVWTDCFRCPKFPNCDEVALIYHLEGV
ncbi:MAG TPA: N-acetyltransferase [Dehalococcoidia bacterium]|jgi:amino-acid N-acetyltransferase|nr:N-acetyltransferase [Dehalococcoidia bacterium]